MSRKARKQYRAQRAQEVQQERAKTDGNEEWKRIGPRDKQHRKTGRESSDASIEATSLHMPLSDNPAQESAHVAYGVKPSYTITTVFKNTGKSGDILAVVRGNPPPDLFGKFTSVMSYGGRTIAYASSFPFETKYDLADALSIAPSRVRTGNYDRDGVSHLLDIAVGVKSIDFLFEKKSEPSAPLKKTGENIAHVFYDESRLPSPVLVLMDGEHIPNILGIGRDESKGTVDGKHFFHFYTAKKPENVAEFLGIDRSRIRVGDYSRASLSSDLELVAQGSTAVLNRLLTEQQPNNPKTQEDFSKYCARLGTDPNWEWSG